MFSLCFFFFLLLFVVVAAVTFSKVNLFILLLNAYFYETRTFTFTITRSLSHFKLTVIPWHHLVLRPCSCVPSCLESVLAGLAFSRHPGPAAHSGSRCSSLASSALSLSPLPALPEVPLGSAVSFRQVFVSKLPSHILLPFVGSHAIRSCVCPSHSRELAFLIHAGFSDHRLAVSWISFSSVGKLGYRLCLLVDFLVVDCWSVLFHLLVSRGPDHWDPLLLCPCVWDGRPALGREHGGSRRAQALSASQGSVPPGPAVLGTRPPTLLPSALTAAPGTHPRGGGLSVLAP